MILQKQELFDSDFIHALFYLIYELYQISRVAGGILV